jgi:hypothetical protein
MPIVRSSEIEALGKRIEGLRSIFKEAYEEGMMEKPTQDPWVHRIKGMSCSTCMYFVPKRTLEGKENLGRCRRHAPTMSGYPVVFPNDWCGDHKLDEEKL